jgi:hypothetical protein
MELCIGSRQRHQRQMEQMEVLEQTKMSEVDKVDGSHWNYSVSVYGACM